MFSCKNRTAETKSSYMMVSFSRLYSHTDNSLKHPFLHSYCIDQSSSEEKCEIENLYNTFYRKKYTTGEKNKTFRAGGVSVSNIKGATLYGYKTETNEIQMRICLTFSEI